MKKNKSLTIVKVTYCGDYKLKLIFSDQHISEVDFEQFLYSSSNPDVIEYRDKSKFKKFKLTNGDLMWGDYEMLFPLMDLYRNSL